MSTADLLNDLNEEPPLKDRPLYSRNSMKWLVVSAIVVSIFWVICNSLYSHYYLGAGNARYFSETLMVMMIANLVVIPVLSFILALLISLLPIRGRNYKRKLVPVWLWTTIVLSNGLFIAVLITG
jgi:hypothetical protein